MFVTDWAAGYVRCGFIGSPVFSFPVERGGGGGGRFFFGVGYDFCIWSR